MQMYTKNLIFDAKAMNNNPPMTEIYTDIETTIRPLTPIDLNFENNSLEESNGNQYNTNIRTSNGGRKKGSSCESKEEFNHRISNAMFKATTLIMN
jgi:hypothetical protein